MKGRSKPDLIEGGIVKKGTIVFDPHACKEEKVIPLQEIGKFKITVNGVPSEEAIQELAEKLKVINKME